MTTNVYSATRARRGLSSCSVEFPPRISRGLLRFFRIYSEGYLRRHFHSVRLLANGAPRERRGWPVVVYLNHSAWWDPLVCLLLARQFFRQRDSYGPIDADALQRYQFFRRLGFFGVANGTVRGAADFLDQARGILAAENSALWLTPQGKFADGRARPLRFQSGLGRLARRTRRAAFLPLAIEYTFWEERLPEVLLSFGEPLFFEAARPLSAPESTQLFESALASVQDQLAAASQRRNPEEWQILVRGHAGTNRVYDLWRRARAKFHGRAFRAAHSDL